MTRKMLPVAVVVALSCLTFAWTTEARTLSADSFHSCFNATSRKNSEEGGVTLTRTTSEDAGCDFGERLPMDAAHARVSVVPAAPVNGGYFNITILFFRDGGEFIREPLWTPDTQSTAPLVLADVREFARKQGITGATSFLLRIRVLPNRFFGKGPGFRFLDISIGPRAAGKESAS